MATLTRSKVLRNRKPSQPHLNPDYPVKPKVDPETGRHYTIVSVRLKAGSFLATIAEDQTVHAQASSRPLAEKNSRALYLDKLKTQPHRTRAGR